MTREDFECLVVAGILRDHGKIRKLGKHFGPELFEEKFFRTVAGFCMGHLDKGRKINLQQLAAHLEDKHSGLGQRLEDLAAVPVSDRDWDEAKESLLAIIAGVKQSDVAHDSGKSGQGTPSGGRPLPEPTGNASGQKNRPSVDGPPPGHPAAEDSSSANENDTPGGEQDNGYRLRSPNPLQELEAKLTNYDAEQALLAAILANETVYTRVCGIVRPEDMADPLHGRILDACGRLVGKGVIPSPVTLKNLFDQDGALREIGGAQYLVELAQSVVSVLHADDYAHQVADLAGRRHTLAVLERAKDELLDFSQDVNVLVAETMHRLPAGMGPSESGMRTKHQVREEIARYVDQPGVFYPSGLAGVDKLLGGGLFAKKLYGLAARHKAGKSALSMSISHALNAQNTMHGFAALEMSDVELEMRDVASDLQVNSLRLMLGSRAQAPVGGGRVIETMGDLPDATIYFSRPGATMADIRGFILQAISRHKITGVIVDYHQLIGQVDDFTEERHLRESAQALAKMCRQLNIWCLLVLQLNQEGNARGGEGIKLACDAYMTLNRDPGADGAYLSLDLCRYKEAGSMGSATVPGLMLDPHGPHFRDNTGPAPELDQAELVL